MLAKEKFQNTFATRVFTNCFQFARLRLKVLEAL